jgi:hypothetical protein
MAGFYQHNNEPSLYLNGEEIFVLLSDCYLTKDLLHVVSLFLVVYLRLRNCVRAQRTKRNLQVLEKLKFSTEQ